MTAAIGKYISWCEKLTNPGHPRTLFDPSPAQTPDVQPNTCETLGFEREQPPLPASLLHLRGFGFLAAPPAALFHRLQPSSTSFAALFLTAISRHSAAGDAGRHDDAALQYIR